MNTERRQIMCPWGVFHVPGEPQLRSLHCEALCQRVFLGEYDFPTQKVEAECESLVDVGCNVGSFIVWAKHRWPQLDCIDAYDPNESALYFARMNVNDCRIPGVGLYYRAVSVDPKPIFKEHTDWGGSRTHGETSGVQVPSIHPKDLPECDILKVDAEGVDADVFRHYPYMHTLKIALFEWHTKADGECIRNICHRAGLTKVAQHMPGLGNENQGNEAWVRL